VATDPYHLILGDAEFDFYCTQIAQIKCDVISVFPEYVCPGLFAGFANRDLDDILVARAKELSRKIREGSKARIVSPLIHCGDKTHCSRILDYLARTHECFDAYGLRVEIDYTETSIATLTTALKKALGVAAKPVFVLDWCYPSTLSAVPEGTIRLPAKEDAEFRLTYLVEAIERATNGNCVFFYSGLEADLYNPQSKPTAAQFWRSSGQLPQRFTGEWSLGHFRGLMDASCQIKQYLIDAISRLAVAKNTHV
jgi:hypothetical protein